MQIIIIYRHPHKFIIIKTELKKLGHNFFKTVLAFRHKQISSSHYHETHFYTILYYFKNLKKSHTNHDHLYSSLSNYKHSYTSISIHVNYNHLYASSQIYNYKKTKTQKADTP